MVKTDDVHIIGSIDCLCPDSTIDGNCLAVTNSPVVWALTVVSNTLNDRPLIVVQDGVDKLSNNINSLTCGCSVVRASSTANSDCGITSCLIHILDGNGIAASGNSCNTSVI